MNIHRTQARMKDQHTRGFTLVEMIVSVALFSIVMLISVGALLALVAANKKAQAIQTVVNNLNIALDGMVRKARQGAVYDASVGCVSNTGAARDCTGGSSQLSFTYYNGQQLTYVFVPPSGASTGYLARSVDEGGFVRLTDQAISITDMKFFVLGTAARDTTQPQLIVAIKGVAGGAMLKKQTTFHIQATAVQRILDL
jgi:prepilin-type N-terminal cleavage/methylation domain-containing protein